MQIHIAPNEALSPNEEQLPLLYALEGMTDFEDAIWRARGILGIKVEDLYESSNTEPRIKAIYDAATELHPGWHLNDDDELFKLSVEKQDEYFVSHPDEVEAITVRGDQFQLRLHNESLQVVTTFHLPGSWSYGVANLICRNIFSLPFEDSVQLQIVGSDIGAYIRSHKITDETAKLVTFAYFGSREGISLTMSSAISKERLKNWIDENFNHIKALAKASNLTEDWHSKAHFKLLRKTWLLRQITDSTGKATSRSAISKQLTEQEGREITPDDVTGYLKEYRRYMREYEKKIRLG